MPELSVQERIALAKEGYAAAVDGGFGVEALDVWPGDKWGGALCQILMSDEGGARPGFDPKILAKVASCLARASKPAGLAGSDQPAFEDFRSGMAWIKAGLVAGSSMLGTSSLGAKVELCFAVARENPDDKVVMLALQEVFDGAHGVVAKLEHGALKALVESLALAAAASQVPSPPRQSPSI